MLTETRKADRKAMAVTLIEIARAAGATADIDVSWSKHTPSAIMVRIKAPGGAHVNIDFDGKSCQPNVFVCSWHIPWDSDVRFSAAWWASINTSHYQKATTIANGFDDLCRDLAIDLAACLSGEAYQQAAVTATWERGSEMETKFKVGDVVTFKGDAKQHTVTQVAYERRSRQQYVGLDNIAGLTLASLFVLCRRDGGMQK